MCTNTHAPTLPVHFDTQLDGLDPPDTRSSERRALFPAHLLEHPYSETAHDRRQSGKHVLEGEYMHVVRTREIGECDKKEPKKSRVGIHTYSPFLPKLEPPADGRLL